MASEVESSNEITEPTAPAITPARINRAESAAESYRKVEANILALPKDQIGRVTTDVAQAAAIALGALPNLLKLREDFEAFADADFFIKKLDTLQDYALAAFYAHVRALPGGSEQEVLQLLERGKPIREKLLIVAEALVGFGLFDAALVQSIRQGQGNLDTAKDLVALAALFNANWGRVQNKVPFELPLVLEAGGIGANLLHAIGVTAIGEVRKDTSYDWLSLRARAFRLLVNEYEELRRAVSFVRWQYGDAAAFAPSLHSGANRRRSGRQGDATGSEPNPPQLRSSDELQLPSSEDPQLPRAAAAVPAGMPGDSPFES